MVSHSQIDLAPPISTATLRGLILVKGVGGLGNRMLSFLTASLLAVVAGRRLLVDWRDSIFTGRAGTAPDLFDALFVSPIVDPLPVNIESPSVIPALWQGRLNETLAVVGRGHDPNFHNRYGSFRDLAVNLRRYDYDENVLLVFWSWREVVRPLRPYLASMDRRYKAMSDWEILREAARCYLQPREDISAAVDKFIANHFGRRMLGLHIRATDMRAPVEKLMQTAIRIAARERCDGVFLSTDNAEVENRVRSALPNVVTQPKELPKGAVPLHYDPNCADRVKRATQALTDMLLLSRCQCLTYAARSSFGCMAGIFAPPGQVTVDVDRFNPRIRAKKFLQSWIY